MDTLLHDIRFAARTLRKTPGFTVVALITLALGIGANCIIFTVVNALLIRPLPYDRPESIVNVGATVPGEEEERESLSYPDLMEVRNSTKSLSSLAGFVRTSSYIGDGERGVPVRGAAVTADLMPLLGIAPAAGRFFLASEDRTGAAPVVILGADIWKDQFNSSPDIVGRQIRLGGKSVTVVGIMPESFNFPPRSNSDYWIPLEPTLDSMRLTSTNIHFIKGVGRLSEGITEDGARAELKQISRTLFAEAEQPQNIPTLDLIPMHEDMVSRIRPALLVLMAAVGFVLLIACANVANLLMTRAASRRREIAIRSALGASRSRLVRQLVIEALLLSLAGGVMGLFLALWGADLLLTLVPRGGASELDFTLDSRVVLFTLALSMITGLIFGLAPALQGSSPDLQQGLVAGGKGGSRHRSRLRRLLVVGEIALSLVLLIGAGLMIRSFFELQDIDPGFDPNNVVSIDIGLSREIYPDPAGAAVFFRSVVDRISAAAGVESAGMNLTLPLSGSNRENTFGIAGRPIGNERWPEGSYRPISEGYFKAMKIPVLQGRAFSNRDNASAPSVVIINDRLAERYFPGENPIGQRLLLGDTIGSEIVGIVGSVRHSTLEEEPKPEYYVPFEQSPENQMSIVVRSSTLDVGEIATIARNAVASVDSRQPLFAIRPFEELMHDATAQRRFTMVLLAVFAGIALVLASVGIYGVIAYSVSQRTHEIGLRMALGARRRDVMAMMAREGLILALAGIGIGMAAAWGLTRMLTGLLYGVSATDTLTFAAISFLLGSVAVIATWIPARRATRVDPTVALREER